VVIEAHGVSKRYGGTLAVDELSFTVEPGRVTGFLGPNGAGKSTTMRIALGLDRPTGGEIRIEGKRYADLHHPLRTVGALLDAKWVHPNRSARAHLTWLATTNKLPRARVDEVIELVGLGTVAGKRAGGFSLGMSQRLGIAAALLGDPKVLLFDEPVNGLDPEGIVWIRRFMQALAAEGRTVLVSSHLLSEMALTAEDLIVIGRGKLIAQCSTEEFVGRAGGSAVRVRGRELAGLRRTLDERGVPVREDGDALLVGELTTDEIGELAAAGGAVLHELAVKSGSLEDAYMRLTGEAVQYHAGPPDAAAAPAGPAKSSTSDQVTDASTAAGVSGGGGARR
jgi:ABC-2 type transport system ATP-binding protein